MKKILMPVMILLCVVLLTCVAGAVKEGEKIAINFKVGDEILYINGKEVKVERPVVVNGVTLVPVRVITEAFGARVDWNGQQRCVTLDYSQVAIKLYIDNKKAYVDGTAVELLEAPRIINGRTMVPLRFITENFGADVDYNDYTKQITVVKVNANSVKDFSLILKKTAKEKVGDSYYGWSADFPKNLNLNYRSFSGNVNIFVHKYINCSIIISILQQGEFTIDNILSMELSTIKDRYTLIGQEKGDSYAKVVYRDEAYAYEDRFYVNEGKVYFVNLIFEDYNSYKANRDVQKFLDSFSVKFVDDGSVEDLSDVTKEGFRLYTNNNLKYSIDVLADWMEVKNSDAENMVSFIDNLGNQVYINIYSYEKGLSLDDVVKSDIDYIKKEYASETYKLENINDVEIGGKKAKELLYVKKDGDTTEYIIEIFMIGENYKYNTGCVLTQDTYNDKKYRQKILDMMCSFKFDEPD
ncbi:copper amine oxidase N-terminal domain-containing protein [Acetivibrio straminisolvens]|uniref:copper amine oxidase N-terminal domain-containing protein n=1 Tax=Acetivibrio straminisolvens TaxID=253314 RepID=UPI00223ED9C8|nr:copper amine oxidase N-terminal domain-containing protein [Acetivibrio straminisolvens]